VLGLPDSIRAGLFDLDELVRGCTDDLLYDLVTALQDGVGDSARAPERSFSRVVFVDAVDPKPKPGEFPTELTVSYEIAATLRGDLPPPDIARTAVLLPITTPPVQVPHLVSAGIAEACRQRLAIHLLTPAGQDSLDHRLGRLWRCLPGRRLRRELGLFG